MSGGPRLHASPFLRLVLVTLFLLLRLALVLVWLWHWGERDQGNGLFDPATAALARLRRPELLERIWQDPQRVAPPTPLAPIRIPHPILAPAVKLTFNYNCLGR